jgi:hypothetical protein
VLFFLDFFPPFCETSLLLEGPQASPVYLVKMMAMIVELWWDDTDWVKPKYFLKKAPQCHFGRHKFHLDRPGSNPGRSEESLTT